MIDVLSELFVLRGVPGHIRSDNGPEFIAEAVQKLIAAVGSKTAYIAPDSPWQNSYVESFNARLRDELLDGEIFSSARLRLSTRVGADNSTPSARTRSSATNHRRPDAKLYRKSNHAAAKLSYIGHAMIENRRAILPPTGSNFRAD